MSAVVSLHSETSFKDEINTDSEGLIFAEGRFFRAGIFTGAMFSFEPFKMNKILFLIDVSSLKGRYSANSLLLNARCRMKWAVSSMAFSRFMTIPRLSASVPLSERFMSDCTTNDG